MTVTCTNYKDSKSLKQKKKRKKKKPGKKNKKKTKKKHHGKIASKKCLGTVFSDKKVLGDSDIYK